MKQLPDNWRYIINDKSDYFLDLLDKLEYKYHNCSDWKRFIQKGIHDCICNDYNNHPLLGISSYIDEYVTEISKEDFMALVLELPLDYEIY